MFYKITLTDYSMYYTVITVDMWSLIYQSAIIQMSLGRKGRDRQAIVTVVGDHDWERQVEADW